MGAAASAISKAVVFGAPEAINPDLPQLIEDQLVHRPLAAAHAVPWSGEMAVFRSPTPDGFELPTAFSNPARISMHFICGSYRIVCEPRCVSASLQAGRFLALQLGDSLCLRPPATTPAPRDEYLAGCVQQSRQ